MKHLIEKFTPFGAIFSAAICPACFPALAGLGSTFGLTFFAHYEKEALIIMQIFIALSVIFAFLSYKRTKYIPSFVISVLSGGIMFFSWYISYHPFAFYTGILGLIISAFWNIWIERKLPSCKDGVCPSKK